MKKFIPKEKLGKKARKQLDTEQRSTCLMASSIGNTFLGRKLSRQRVEIFRQKKAR